MGRPCRPRLLFSRVTAGVAESVVVYLLSRAPRCLNLEAAPVKPEETNTGPLTNSMAIRIDITEGITKSRVNITVGTTPEPRRRGATFPVVEYGVLREELALL
jgi:hypothetical protein